MTWIVFITDLPFQLLKTTQKRCLHLLTANSGCQLYPSPPVNVKIGFHVSKPQAPLDVPAYSSHKQTGQQLQRKALI
jgi:hypothetical protein